MAKLNLSEEQIKQINSLTPDRLLSGLRNTGQEDVAKRFERRMQSNMELNPADIQNTTTPDLPSGSSTRENDAMNNVQTGVFNFEEDLNTALSKIQSGTATQEDLNKLDVSTTRQMLDLIKGREGKAKDEERLNKEFEIEEQTKQIQEYQNQLAAEQRSLEISKRRLMENPEGVFGSGALSAQIRNLERKSLEKQADIAILGNAARGNLDTSLALIQNKLDLKYGDQEEQLNNFMLQVDAVSGLTYSVKSQLKQQAQDEKDQMNSIRSLQDSAFKMAAEIAKDNPALAQQMYAQMNTDFQSVEEAQQVFDSLRSSALSSGAFTDTGSTASSPLSINQVSKYKSEYPDLAGEFYPGMTEFEANTVIAEQMGIDRTIMIQSFVDSFVEQNLSKDEIAKQIEQTDDPQERQIALDYLNSLDLTKKEGKDAYEMGQSLRQSISSRKSNRTSTRGLVPRAGDFFAGLFSK